PIYGGAGRVELSRIAPQATARLMKPEANETAAPAPQKYNHTLGPTLPALRPVPTMVAPVPSTPATIEVKPIQVNDPPRILPSKALSDVHGAVRPKLGT